MHQNGVTAKEIQKIIRHRIIQIMLDIYIYTDTKILRDATDVLDQVING